MSNTAIIEFGDEVVQALTSFKNDTNGRALKLDIENEALIAREKIPCSGTPEEDFDTLQDHLEPKASAFMIIRLERTVAHPEFVLAVYIPSGCPVRPRTIFASGRLPVQRRLGQIFTGLVDYFIDDAKELTYEQFLNCTKKDDRAMSYEELQARMDAKEATVAQVQLPQHDTFTWPVEDALLDLLRGYASGSGPRFIAGKASDTGGAITVSDTGDHLSDIDASAPRYVAVRYDCNGTEVKAFVLFCCDTAPARQKMMSSTCKHSFVQACGELGITFEKTFEIRDKSDFTDANLESLINPTDVSHGYGGVVVHQKPRRPGRR